MSTQLKKIFFSFRPQGKKYFQYFLFLILGFLIGCFTVLLCIDVQITPQFQSEIQEVTNGQQGTTSLAQTISDEDIKKLILLTEEKVIKQDRSVQNNQTEASENNANVLTKEGNTKNEKESFQEFIASKNSNLYHHRSCSVVQRIKEENRLFFKTKEEAEKSGRTPSECTKEYLGI